MPAWVAPSLEQAQEAEVEAAAAAAAAAAMAAAAAAAEAVATEAEPAAAAEAASRPRDQEPALLAPALRQSQPRPTPPGSANAQRHCRRLRPPREGLGCWSQAAGTEAQAPARGGACPDPWQAPPAALGSPGSGPRPRKLAGWLASGRHLTGATQPQRRPAGATRAVGRAPQPAASRRVRRRRERPRRRPRDAG